MSFKTRETIIDDLVKAVGTMDSQSWKKMWLTLGRTIPVSAISGKAYRGGNRWLLLMMQSIRGYPTARWLTKRQIHEAGGRVKDEEFRRDVLCEYWSRVTSKKKSEETPASDEKAGRSRLIVRPFWLYNVAQTQDLPDELVNGPAEVLKPLNLRYEEADRVISATGAVIHHGDDRAYYTQTKDEIHMPDPQQFMGDTDEVRIARYYATTLHELGHWTGHPSRLNRLSLTYFGSPEYAREELVAEFASAILCAELGIPMDELQHPEYLANWLQVVKEDPAALLKGANAAEAAVAHVLSYSKAAAAAENEEAEEVAHAA